MSYLILPTVRISTQLLSREVTRLYSLGTSTVNHVRTNTRSLMSSLSSNVARKAPLGARRAFLIYPRMPETLQMPAPSNLATSSSLLNMPRMNAVFLYILKGRPTSFNFLVMWLDLSISSTVPVAAILNSGWRRGWRGGEGRRG